ncbi:hypothetical protein GGS24DRAFT_107736 [Hypoxylon argillaceum]|nr:hypothetical protein GGS24DRAFT_107736 [Hypoxylon argillaceum]KAI1144766.1 hypothetical protein F4825DRAFT_458239 [Nemania diffusa]
MPRTKAGYKNESGVSSQTDDGVFYVNGRYLCQRLKNGTPCNREMAATTHNISSHNSHFHKEGPYQEQMTKRIHECYHEDCDHKSDTFLAILGHLRRSHGFRGSSEPLFPIYGYPVRNKRKRKEPVEKKDRKKQRQGVKDVISENKPQEAKEESNGNKSPEPEVSVREETPKELIQYTNDPYASSEEFLNCIDPALLQWDKGNVGSGDGNATSI